MIGSPEISSVVEPPGSGKALARLARACSKGITTQVASSDTGSSMGSCIRSASFMVGLDLDLTCPSGNDRRAMRPETSDTA